MADEVDIEAKLGRLWFQNQKQKDHFLRMLRAFFRRLFDKEYVQTLTPEQKELYFTFSVFTIADTVVIQWSGVNCNLGIDWIEIYPFGQQEYEVYYLWQREKIHAAIRKYLFRQLKSGDQE
jgi:hypothetical protein